MNKIHNLRLNTKITHNLTANIENYIRKLLHNFKGNSK